MDTPHKQSIGFSSLSSLRRLSLVGLFLTSATPCAFAADLTVEGALHIDSYLDFGTTSELEPRAAVTVTYGENGSVYTTRMSATRDQAGFLWAHNAGGTAKNKMNLAADNVLSLYDAASGLAKITLNPNTGKITLGTGGGIVLPDGTLVSGISNFRSTALYDASGNPKLTVDATGNLQFSGGATSFGYGTSATGDFSTSFGTQTSASGLSSASFGNSTTASGLVSASFGTYTFATGDASASFGFGTEASGEASASFGYVTFAPGYASASFGQETSASGFISACFGWGTVASGPTQLVIGHFNTPQAIPPYDESDPSTWPATGEIFTIGNGSGGQALSNAFVVRRNGNTEISGNLLSNGADNTLPNQTLTGDTSILTQGLADGRYVKPATLGSYLTTATAGTTYLTQTNASTTYLAQSSATSTYLTQTAASTTYLTPSAGDDLFLTPAEGNTNYIVASELPGLLTESEASSTYLTQTSASSTYQAKAGPLAIGSSVAVSGANSSAIGANLNVAGYQQFVIGRYHEETGSTTAWEGADPLFVVGNGTITTPRNAFVIAKNGSLRGTGASNKLPNQTLEDDGSVLTRGLADARYVTQGGPGSYLTQAQADLRYYQQAPDQLVLNSNGVADTSAALLVGIGGTGTPANSLAISKTGNLTALGSGSFGGTLNVTGAIAANHNLSVAGEFTATGTVNIGDSNTITGAGSTAVGSNLHITGAGQVVFGSFNDPSGDPANWVPTDDLLVVANGTGETQRSNALVVKKNGDASFQGNVTISGEATITRVAAQGDILMGEFGD